MFSSVARMVRCRVGLGKVLAQKNGIGSGSRFIRRQIRSNSSYQRSLTIVRRSFEKRYINNKFHSPRRFASSSTPAAAAAASGGENTTENNGSGGGSGGPGAGTFLLIGGLGIGAYFGYKKLNGSGSSGESHGSGIVFPTTACPEKIPDLSKHNNFMAEVLKADPLIYDNLKYKVSASGVTFAKCIKTGMENPSHPMIKTVGMVAGDEESYDLFSELFDPVIDGRHGGYGKTRQHRTDMDCSKLSDTVIDPSGSFVISTRVRTGRSIRGIRLPPCITFDERRKIEEIVTSAVLSNGNGFTNEWKCDYFPLCGSSSFGNKPNGMSVAKEDEMRANHFLFQIPDSTLLISSEMDRHWPDGRGIVSNAGNTFLVWVNEEDHMRIISMAKGSNIKDIFTRFADGIKKVEKGINRQGYQFMHNDHLGYILTCPSNLGTGLRASVLVKIPMLSKRDDFQQIAKSLRLGVRGFSGVDSKSEGGIYDLSNKQRIGYSEVELVNVMIEGCAKIVKWETMLQQGQSIDHLIPK